VPHIDLVAALPLAAAAGQEAVRKTLVAMADRSRAGGVSFSAAATSGSTPVAKIEVPVVLHYDDSKEDANGALSLQIEARTMEALFPRFEGQIAVEPAGSADSQLHLRGQYHVPSGVLGTLANTATLDTVAKESLQRFIEDLARETLATVADETEMRLRDVRRGVS